MTVGAVLARIKEFEDAAEKLHNCITAISEASAEEKDQLRSKYGIINDELFNAVRLLEITANNCREALNKCEVDCKYWK